MPLTMLYCEEALLDINTESKLDIETYLQVKSLEDRVLLEDERVRMNMLLDEKKVNKIDYCASFQTEIKPHMRKIVVDWMLEVCQDQQCQPQVFHLSLNYMDCFLSKKRIKKTQFQLLATVCLFLASKMSESVPLSAEKLLIYTDNSVILPELLQWELLVLTTLHWELSAVTSRSFLEHFQNLTCVRAATRDLSTVQSHADHLLAIMAAEYQYMLLQPSLLAAAALSAAVRGQGHERRGLEQLNKNLSEVIGRPAKEIELVAHSVEDLLDSYKEIMNFKSKMQEGGNVMSCEEYCIS
jgi:hypothetical protein